MATASPPTAADPPIARTPTLGEVPRDEIPPHRILLHPTPGTATAADVEAIRLREDRLCELVDATLVEKTMGSSESNLATRLIYLMMTFTEPRRLGEFLGADGMIRFAPNQVRLPDAAFYRRERLPGGAIPRQAILDINPDLVVEILSEGNTRAEMDRKLREYLAAGLRLVWYADPRRREVAVSGAVDHVRVLGESAALDGGAVLPGFALRVVDWLR